jgi:hypothetical protein
MKQHYHNNTNHFTTLLTNCPSTRSRTCPTPSTSERRSRPARANTSETAAAADECQRRWSTSAAIAALLRELPRRTACLAQNWPSTNDSAMITSSVVETKTKHTANLQFEK